MPLGFTITITAVLRQLRAAGCERRCGGTPVDLHVDGEGLTVLCRGHHREVHGLSPDVPARSPCAGEDRGQFGNPEDLR